MEEELYDMDEDVDVDTDDISHIETFKNGHVVIEPHAWEEVDAEVLCVENENGHKMTLKSTKKLMTHRKKGKSENAGKQCAICLDWILSDEIVARNHQCKHVLHLDCLKKHQSVPPTIAAPMTPVHIRLAGRCPYCNCFPEHWYHMERNVERRALIDGRLLCAWFYTHECNCSRGMHELMRPPMPIHNKKTTNILIKGFGFPQKMHEEHMVNTSKFPMREFGEFKNNLFLKPMDYQKLSSVLIVISRCHGTQNVEHVIRNVLGIKCV